jgi:hypothetical protein
LINRPRRIVAYLDGLPPIGDLRSTKVNTLREFSSPTLRYGDATQSASGDELRLLFGRMLMPSILDKFSDESYKQQLVQPVIL